MVGALMPAMGAHVVIKFHHDFGGVEKVGECIVSLTHLLKIYPFPPTSPKTGKAEVEMGASTKPVHIKDIPVTNSGLHLGSASGSFQLTFLGGCKRE